jgi:hypothetical protein
MLFVIFLGFAFVIVMLSLFYAEYHYDKHHIFINMVIVIILSGAVFIVMLSADTLSVTFLFLCRLSRYILSFTILIIMMSVIMLSVIRLSGVMLSVIMLSVIVLSVVMLSVLMLSVLMLSVVMLSVIMLSVIMLSVVMLGVVAPLKTSFVNIFYDFCQLQVPPYGYMAANLMAPQQST